MELKNKTILITGGASGIGLEAAKQFLQLGAKVIITGRNEEKLNAAKTQLPMLTIIKSDVASEEDTLALFQQIRAIDGIDILYNNAGILKKTTNLGSTNSRHFYNARDEMDINYLGVVRLNNLFMEMLTTRAESAIINTSSILSYAPANTSATYSASKVAVRFYTEALRRHLRIIKSPVKVFELLPPLVATDMAEGIEGAAITPEKLVNSLIKGLKNDTYTIRVGMTKLMYIISRLSPTLAAKLLNPSKSNAILQ